MNADADPRSRSLFPAAAIVPALATNAGLVSLIAVALLSAGERVFAQSVKVEQLGVVERRARILGYAVSPGNSRAKSRRLRMVRREWLSKPSPAWCSESVGTTNCR